MNLQDLTQQLSPDTGACVQFAVSVYVMLARRTMSLLRISMHIIVVCKTGLMSMKMRKLYAAGALGDATMLTSKDCICGANTW